MGIIGTNCFYPLGLRLSVIPLDLKEELCNLFYFNYKVQIRLKGN